MTPLRIALLVVAVLAGDYAFLMLIDGRLIHFGIAAAICAGSSLAAGLIAYGDDDDARRQHESATAAVGERRDQWAATAAGPQCLLCGGAHQKTSDSPRFADRQGARFCEACVPFTADSRRDESAGGLT